jgi:serine/threonine protein kinase
MDYFEDGDLHTRMVTARRTFVPVPQVLRYLLQLMQGLAHLHALDVVHCDVAPANIFLRGERDKDASCCSLALGDFGHSYILNKHQESRSSVAQQGLGAEFVAPEVKAGEPSTKESDIFSAGKILKALLNLSEMVVQPKSVLQMLRGLAADMCGVSTRRPTAREVCVRLQNLAS